MMLLSSLNKIIQRERKVTRGMFFVWLRALCLPPALSGKSGNVSRTVSSTTTAAATRSSTNANNLYGGGASLSATTPHSNANKDSHQSGIHFISHNRNGYRLFVVLRLLLGIPPKAVNDWLDLPSSKAIPALRNFPRDQEPLTT
eukprot:TRINITY_DN8012_c0_g1_i6.p1 TRINITY_DN8012_c0_g1~~TRINITY_DN8012_c0_g1_i6.p1  ORF type:complete len:144 (-),score=16.58 TRINITY_DN8012_c0_g1_i6:244-675(-)